MSKKLCRRQSKIRFNPPKSASSVLPLLLLSAKRGEASKSVKRIKRLAHRGYKSEVAKNVNITSYYSLLPFVKGAQTRVCASICEICGLFLSISTPPKVGAKLSQNLFGRVAEGELHYTNISALVSMVTRTVLFKRIFMATVLGNSYSKKYLNACNLPA